MKILDLSNWDELKKKLPEGFEDNIRKLEGQNIYIVTSFGDTNRPYKVEIESDGANGYMAECTCPGWGRLKKKEEPVTPCRHMVAIIAKTKKTRSSGIVEVPNPAVEEDIEEETKETADNTSNKDEEGLKRAIEKIKKEPVAEKAEIKNEIKIRSSGLPLIDICPAAAAASSDIIIETSGWAAKIGSATHRMIKDVIKGNLSFIPKTYPYASIWGCEEAEDEIKFLGISMLQAWRNGISDWYTNPEIEQELEYSVNVDNKTLTLTGHPDLHEIKGEEAIVTDWKSGRRTKEIEHRSQMRGYAFLVAAQNKNVKKVRTTLVFLREREQYTYIFTRNQLRKWMKGLINKVLNWNGKTYNAGKHCAFCPLRLTCKAWNAELRTAVANFANAPSLLDEEGQLLPADIIYRAHEQKNLLKRAIKAFEDAEKMQLLSKIKKEGDIAIPGTDKKFSYKIRQGRSSIEPVRALPILREYLDGEDIDKVVTIGKQLLSKAIRDTASEGQKGKLTKEIMEELEKEGALTRGKPSDILTVKEDANAGNS